MTRDISPDLKTIPLYLTEPHPCSYLDDRNAITAFVDPKLEISGDAYNRLSLLGFRRSGKYVYTPRCVACKSCIPLRIPASRFKTDRQQRRSLKRNADLVVTSVTAIDIDEHYRIFERYINVRHSDGDMYPPSLGQFQTFIGDAWDCTRYLEFRLDGQLICCAVIDWLSSGLSAIYTYFDPDFASRSLGTFAILKQIQLTAEYQLDYVYLGYWIRDSDKMSYKSRFHPQQLYIDNTWMDVG